MSLAELGLDGVWSCLYCEGTWLTAAEVRALLAKSGALEASRPVLPATLTTEGSLVCPACTTRSLAEIAVGSYKAHCCTDCQSIFFAKDVLLSLHPVVGAGASGPEVAGKVLAETVGWLILAILPLGSP